MTRLRALNEAECYTRCYGTRDDNVTVVRAEPRRRKAAATVSGEEMRRSFEQRLETRDPEELAEPEAA